MEKYPYVHGLEDLIIKMPSLQWRYFSVGLQIQCSPHENYRFLFFRK